MANLAAVEYKFPFEKILSATVDVEYPTQIEFEHIFIK